VTVKFNRLYQYIDLFQLEVGYITQIGTTNLCRALVRDIKARKALLQKFPQLRQCDRFRVMFIHGDLAKQKRNGKLERGSQSHRESAQQGVGADANTVR